MKESERHVRWRERKRRQKLTSSQSETENGTLPHFELHALHLSDRKLVFAAADQSNWWPDGRLARTTTFMP